MEQQLQQAVHELKEFHDNFLSSNTDQKETPNTLISRTNKVREKSEDVLKQIDDELNSQTSDARKSTLLLLKGKLIQLVDSEYSKAAAEALKKSVKLDPTYTEAWNELGESYWRNGDAIQAKNCFEHAVKHSNTKNADSLCKLSMILRQISYQPTDEGNKERSESLLKSLDLARKAIKLEINNGNAWYTLGNAYLNMVTVGAGDVRQAITAYKKAEDVDVNQKFNPDLHFNKAQLLMYRCDFTQALEEFRISARIDTTWTEASEKVEAIETHLEIIAEQIRTKGKLKPRKLEQMKKKLKNPENERCGLVIASTSPNAHLLAFSAILLMPNAVKDSPDKFVVVRVNNLKDSVKIGDTLEFSKEVVVQNSLTLVRGKQVKLDYVSIKAPNNELLVNNRRMNASGMVGLTSSMNY